MNPEEFADLLANIEPTPAMVRRVVALHEASAARSQQKSIGLSEIGDLCDRRVAMKLAGIEGRPGADKWLASIGTATHAWLADAFRAENERLGRERFLIEQRVEAAPELPGTCDLFDTDNGAVWDHKILGEWSYGQIAAGTVKPTYRVQLHSYGRGHERAGREVKTVGLLAYPRFDNLTGTFRGKGLVVWSEPYSRDLALAAIERAEELRINAALADWATIAAWPSHDCKFCPFLRPGAVSETGCPGYTERTVAPTVWAGIV